MSKGCSKPDSSSIAVLLLNICSGLGCPDISHGREKSGNCVKAVHWKVKAELKAFLQPFLPDQPPITLALATNTQRPSPPCIVSWQSVFSRCFVFFFFFFLNVCQSSLPLSSMSFCSFSRLTQEIVASSPSKSSLLTGTRHFHYSILFLIK